MADSDSTVVDHSDPKRLELAVQAIFAIGFLSEELFRFAEKLDQTKNHISGELLRAIGARINVLVDSASELIEGSSDHTHANALETLANRVTYADH